MPRISEFFGVIITMYFNDHSPPHFHATYGEFEALYRIDTLEVLWGELPRRPNSFVLEWAAIHRTEIMDDWEKARQGLTLNKIAPLE